MFIIPIGTKSSLALKPKLTIALIAANTVVSIITIPLMLQTERSLFNVQRERFARQLELYVSEKHPTSLSGSVSQASVDGAASDLENAKDPRSFQMALFNALSVTGIQPQEFEEYGETLRGRTDSYFLSIDGSFEHFIDWKTLIGREDKIIERSPLNMLGLIPSKMSRIHTFFTHIFVHAGIWHLVGNMLFLWVVGCLLEDSWGRLPFFIFYIAGGIIGGLAHSFQDTSSAMPLVGASGAIAAAMGAFTIRHFFTKIRLWYFFLLVFRPYWGTFYLPAFVFLPIWFIEQVALHYISGYLGTSNVAYMAHIGGFSAGLLAALAMRATGFEERFLAPRVHKKRVEAGVLRDPRFERACKMLDDGNIETAKGIFNALIAERREDANLIQDVALMYREKGLMAEYGDLADRVLKLMLLKGRLEEASRLALEIVTSRDPVTLNPQSLMRVAKWLAERELCGEAHDVYRAIISQGASPVFSAKAHIALARLLNEKMNGAEEALRVLQEGRRTYPDGEWVAAMSQLEEEIRKIKVAVQS